MKIYNSNWFYPAIILILLIYIIYSSVSPKYPGLYSRFSGTMELELKNVSKKIMNNSSIKNGIIESKSMDNDMQKTINKYKIINVKKQNKCIYYTISGFLDDEWGVTYSS